MLGQMPCHHHRTDMHDGQHVAGGRGGFQRFPEGWGFMSTFSPARGVSQILGKVQGRKIAFSLRIMSFWLEWRIVRMLRPMRITEQGESGSESYSLKEEEDFSGPQSVFNICFI